MTLEEKIKHTIGDLVIQLHVKQIEIEQLQAKIKELENGLTTRS